MQVNNLVIRYLLMNREDMKREAYDIVVVGGGIYGLCIAYYLTKNPNIKTLLIEQYQIGHHHGSSHSPTRITRSTYDKQLYRDLNTKALQEHWKELQTLLNTQLVYITPFIYLDNQQHSFLEYKKVVGDSENFQILSPQEVVQKYTSMPFVKSEFDHIIDKKAGILAAGEVISKLKSYLLSNCNSNFTLLENTEVKHIYETNEGVQLRTQKKETFKCKKAILSSGRWVSQLVPQISHHFKVVKQYVSYLQLQDMEKYDVTRFNSFYYRYTDDMHFYCLPDHDSLGVKFARHAFSLNPQEDNFEYQSKFLHSMAKLIFGENFIKIKKIENCYYTHTPTEDFILDYVDPVSEKILVCSCCSGHGFKFAPIIGDIAAQLAQIGYHTNNKSVNNPIYNKWQHVFKFPYHQGINLN